MRRRRQRTFIRKLSLPKMGKPNWLDIPLATGTISVAAGAVTRDLTVLDGSSPSGIALSDMGKSMFVHRIIVKMIGNLVYATTGTLVSMFATWYLKKRSETTVTMFNTAAVGMFSTTIENQEDIWFQDNRDYVSAVTGTVLWGSVDNPWVMDFTPRRWVGNDDLLTLNLAFRQNSGSGLLPMTSSDAAAFSPVVRLLASRGTGF